MKRLEECFEPGFQPKETKDPSPKFCGPNDPKFTDDVPNSFKGSIDKNEGLGKAIFCDPMTTGQIVNTTDGDDDINKSTIYRYAKGLRATDEAVKDLFSNVHVLDIQGKAFKVPIIWGSQERAVAVLIQENVRKDNSLVVDRIRLPIMSIYTSSHYPNNERYVFHGAIDYFNRLTKDGKPAFVAQEQRHPRDTVFGRPRGIPIDLGYTLTIWTRYWEDMNQILEQIYLKFSGGVAYIKVQGVTNWEPVVKLDSISNNINTEPGDRQERVIKFEIGLTAETFIPQPLARRRSVLKEKIEFTDGIELDEIQEVIDRLEEVAEGLEE